MSPRDPTELRSGDVLRYVPDIGHCREGIAFVTKSGVALDTYWGAEGDNDSHRLTERELAGADVLFNVDAFDPLDRYSSASRDTWKAYHPDDRARITSQHGLQEALFTRRGAVPHHGTQIDNARVAVVGAEEKLLSAQHALERRRDELAVLLADTGKRTGAEQNWRPVNVRPEFGGEPDA